MRRIAARRLIPVVGAALATLATAVPAPAGAGPPPVCAFNICTVEDEPQFLTALTELSSQTFGVSRINLTAGFVISPSSNPTYSGSEPLVIDGNGHTLDGNGTAQIIASSSTESLSLLDITIDSGAGSGGSTAIDATGDVHVNDSVLQFNISTTDGGTQNGGAIRSFGNVEIHDSDLNNNRAINTAGTARGGVAVATGDIYVGGSTVTNNLADGSGIGLARGGAFDTNASVTIENSTLSDNDAEGSSVQGGAIYSGTTTDITDSIVERNVAVSTVSGATGGAVNAGGDITLTRSVLDGNEARGHQAAIGGAANTDGGTVTVTDSQLVENAARATNSIARGGAIAALNNTTLEVRGSTLRDNNAISGGSITTGGAVHIGGGSALLESTAVVRNSAQGTGTGGGLNLGTGGLTAHNSTIADNIAASAGAVSSGSSLNLRFTTVSGNSSTGSAQLVATGLLSTAATVVAQPAGTASNCSVPNGVSQVASYSDDTTCDFDDDATDRQDFTDMLLGPARDNGGVDTGPAESTPGPRTRTSVYPLLGSPVIDAIESTDCIEAADGLPLFDDDQRGVDRPFGAACDIGAIEAVFPAHGFTDVIPFYEPTIRWVASPANTPQILLGFPDNTFGAGLNITRGNAARLYYRAAGAPDVSGLADPFPDVTPFYRDAVKWAEANDIFDGFADNTFRQDQPISRGNFTRSLYGFVGQPSPGGDHGFTDVIPFYDDAVRWAKGNGLADGFADNTYRTANNITRGNTARIFYNSAQSPSAWAQDGDNAPANMLFRSNLG